MEFVTIEINSTKYRVAKDDEASFRKMLTDQAAATKTLTEAAADVDKKIEEAVATAKVEAQTELDAAKKKLTDAAEKGDQSATITLLTDSVKALNDRVEKAEEHNKKQGAKTLLTNAVRGHKLSKAEADSDAWQKIVETDPKMFAEMIKNKPEVVPVEPDGGDGDSKVDATASLKQFNEMVTERVKVLKDAGNDAASDELRVIAQDEIANENPELGDVVFQVPTQATV